MTVNIHPYIPERQEAARALEAVVEGALGAWEGYSGACDIDGYVDQGPSLDGLLYDLRDRLSDLGYETTPQAFIQRGLPNFPDKIDVKVEAESGASAKRRQEAQEHGIPEPEVETRLYVWDFAIPEDA